MNEHLDLLDVVLDYVNEQGLYNDFLTWAEMYDHDKEELDERLENRYNNL